MPPRKKRRRNRQSHSTLATKSQQPVRRGNRVQRLRPAMERKQFCNDSQPKGTSHVSRVPQTNRLRSTLEAALGQGRATRVQSRDRTQTAPLRLKAFSTAQRIKSTNWRIKSRNLIRRAIHPRALATASRERTAQSCPPEATSRETRVQSASADDHQSPR
jgi:hypothetical protein